MALRILLLATLLILASNAVGHGAFVEPPARGTCNSPSINNASPRNSRIAQVYKAIRDDRCAFADCPHCLNSGGTGAVALAGGGQWTPYEPLNPSVPFRKDFGLCGDPAVGDKPHEKGGIYAYPRAPILKTYMSDSKVQFVIDVTTNHNGYFEFFICDATKCDGDINEQCFKNGHCFQLNRVTSPECDSQDSPECAPIDKVYPGRWYVTCRKGDHVGEHFMGGPFMEYQLPSGFSSDHAVIQWYWVTANSCNPPGFMEYFEKYPMQSWRDLPGGCPGDGGAVAGRNALLPKCGGARFPEEFWNCADVIVSANGQAPIQSSGQNGNNRATPTPTRTPTPTPTPSKSATDNKNDLEARKDEQPSCAGKWMQCNGKLYKGIPDCCITGYTCVYRNDYYSQCLKPGAK